MTDLFFAAIDLSSTSTKIGLVRQGEVIARTISTIQSTGRLDACLPELSNQINQLIEQERLPVEKLAGVGLAVPGLVDSFQKKIVDSKRKYHDASDYSVDQWVQHHWNRPCIMDNYARMLATGEWKYGARDAMIWSW